MTFFLHRGEPMKKMTKLLIVLLLLATPTVLTAEIFEWTDENGVKHYTDTPPPEKKAGVKTVSAIQPSAAEENKKVAQNENTKETELNALIEEIDKEAEESENLKRQAQVTAGKNKAPTRQEMIQQEREKLEYRLDYLENQPPAAFNNARSRQVMIGRYKYKLQQLDQSPEAYFGW